MSESDASRTVVKTYVPAYQKAEWVEHAEAMNMSQSEFVRAMVQAGRADFSVDPYPERDGESGRTEMDASQPSGHDADADPAPNREDGPGSGETFEDRVYALLQDETRSWDELLDAITADVEDRLEDALQSLQASNKVVYSGRNGGYEALEE